MIDHDSLARQQAAAQQSWATADPFAYCVFEDFLTPAAAAQLVADFPGTITRAAKKAKKHHDVDQKRGVPKREIMSEAQLAFFDKIQSPAFLRYLEELTGIAPLYADPDLNGGGLHEISTGGFLNVHADFNFHPQTRKLRCLNLILYLNPDWQEDWHGHLELWDRDLEREPVRIAPQMNRAALFRTSETSWHGHPTPLACPPEVKRQSMAVYYYTDWPDGLEHRAATTYVLTPPQQAALRDILRGQMDQLHSVKAAQKAAPSYQPRHVQQVYEALRAEQAGSEGP